MNTVEKILARIAEADGGVSQKTASVAEPTRTAPAAELTAQVEALAQKVASAASVQTPVSALEKMAADAAASEQELLRKEASFLGAAICDGFMQRMAAYDASLTAQGVKTASTPDETLLKQAAYEGYVQGLQEKEAAFQAEFERGYVDEMREIHKTASEIHLAGQVSARNVLTAIRQGQGA